MKFIYHIRFTLFLLIFIILSSCNRPGSLFLSSKHKTLNIIKNSDVLKNEFTGFVLYDLDKKKEILNLNGNKYFTPASNTKLYTFYTALKVLGDSMPALKYLIKNDSMIFWGTGNPLILNPDFSFNKTAIELLKSQQKHLFYCNDNYIDEKYGSGWAWDDYLYYYQLEKSALPVFGNRLSIKFINDSIIINPEFLKNNISYIEDSNEYWRPWHENSFIIGKFQDSTTLEIPVIADEKFIKNSLKYLTGEDINDCIYPVYDSTQAKTLKIPFPDSIYIRLLHQSDNFIAEQLMLMCSYTLFDTMSTKMAIEWSKEHLLPGLKDNCRWVDGSGLSRYNLFSPSDMIYVLNNIYNTIGLERIKVLFPTAGHSGTLKNSYKNIKNSYIWAKSGSLSNNYNLSGFIKTRKGNLYIFSFMNNHFLAKNKDIKAEMEKVFEYIYNQL